MIEIIERLLNRINTRGLKIINFLIPIIYLILANMLIICAVYDMRNTYFGVNIIIYINICYFLAYAFLQRFLKKRKNITTREVLLDITLLIVALDQSIEVFFELSSIVSLPFDIHFIQQPLADFMLILMGGLCILLLLLKEK